MHKLFEFIVANWDTLASAGAAVGAGLGWFAERKARKRDIRDSDVAFWEKTIDRQNEEIKRIVDRMDSMRNDYEMQIKQLVERIAKLTAKVEMYEAQSHKTHIHTP